MAETSHLYPSLKNASKAGAYPNEAPYDTLVYLLTNIRMEVNAIEKQPSLFKVGFNFGRNQSLTHLPKKSK